MKMTKKTPAKGDAEVAQEAQEEAAKAIAAIFAKHGIGKFCGSITGTHSRVVTYVVGDEVLTVRWVWPG